MEFDHRKLLIRITKRDDDGDGKHDCSDCKSPKKPWRAETEMIRRNILITGFVITAVFFLCLVFMILKRYFSRRRTSAERPNRPILFDTQQDFIDEDQGPALDHPIWYINTIGLPQSVIDSITVCQYKRDQGLIDGTECSVCLSEFEDDQNVRLLPKCSHAFHVNCIDIWLRSHKNCPLCRAPIVCENSSVSGEAVPELNSSGLRIVEETRMETNETPRVLERSQVEDGESREARVEDASDLVDKREMVRAMRRSVSVDASSAVAIYRAVAAVVSDQGSSNSSSQLAVAVKSLNSGAVSKRASQNLSLFKLMRSASMKRSRSSSRSFFASKHRRSQSLILPS